MTTTREVRYDYTPDAGPQAAAFRHVVDELFYGGAAGGGKSRMARAAAVLFAMLIPGARVVIFRRSHPELRDAVLAPMLLELPPSLARYNKQASEFTFINGSVIRLAHLGRASELQKYQGAEYQLVIFEEVTHFTKREYLYMKSRLRVAGEVRDRMEAQGMRPRMIATGNPGGIGHHWVKARFVDPAPAGTLFRTRPTAREPRPGVRLYIHAKATDNSHIDPSYNDMLNALPDGERAALRDGDWDVMDGVRFPGFKRGLHVIRPEDFPLPPVGAFRAIGVDWGSSAPFAAVWVAKVGEAYVVYREAYAKGLTPDQQAERIHSVMGVDENGPGRITPIALDPACWARSPQQPLAKATPANGAPPPGSIARAYWDRFGTLVQRANNDRLGGAATLDRLLTPRDWGDGEAPAPSIYIYDTCRNLIRTLPALPRDERNPEDVDTHAEDHAYDALRYAIMALEGKAQRRPSAADYALPTSTADMVGRSF